MKHRTYVGANIPRALSVLLLLMSVESARADDRAKEILSVFRGETVEVTASGLDSAGVATVVLKAGGGQLLEAFKTRHRSYGQYNLDAGSSAAHSSEVSTPGIGGLSYAPLLSVSGANFPIARTP